ncbi:unnamed protein product [Leptosia nina]|uniref:Transmembrane protein n=1 Tax=Leptosia nina TaxID=320188 RepID=A0AAV1JCC5_9NEOP
MAKLNWVFVCTLLLALFSIFATGNACKKKIPCTGRAPCRRGPYKDGMETELFQEVVVLLVTLLLSYLESCFACTRVRYNDCTDSNAKCRK